MFELAVGPLVGRRVPAAVYLPCPLLVSRPVLAQHPADPSPSCQAALRGAHWGGNVCRSEHNPHPTRNTCYMTASLAACSDPVHPSLHVKDFTKEALFHRMVWCIQVVKSNSGRRMG